MTVIELLIPARPLYSGDIDAGRIGTDRLNAAPFHPVTDAAGTFIGVIRTSRLLPLIPGTGWSQHLEADVCRLSPETKIEDIFATAKPLIVEDANGAILGIVTAESLANARCARAEQKYRHLLAIIDCAQNGIIVVDPEGRILIANAFAARLLGTTADKMPGKKATDFVENSPITTILKDRKPVYYHKIKTNKSTIIATYSPLFIDGDFYGALSIFQDISSLNDVYTELDQVKSLLEERDAIIETSYDGLCIVDGSGIVLRVNRAYQAITGVGSAEIVGKTMLHMIQQGIYDRSVSKLVMEQKTPVTISQSIKGRHFLVTGNPLFDEQGNVQRVVTNLRDITELSRLQEQLEQTRNQSKRYETELNQLKDQYFDRDDGIVFRGRTMEQILLVAAKVALVDSTVLITGESGTGKELIAKLIHRRGKDAAAPFIKINCAALPENLLESELFGYEAGSFTGARKGGKPGMFELAQGGTLFLDEIGDMPPFLQVKLLRALQEKEIMRLGGTKSISVDVRIIAATHRDLTEMLKKGGFREDLYYRLMVVPIHLPPLRERKEDLPALVAFFLDKYNRKMRLNKKIGSEAMDVMLRYSWPGNIRELENVIERMIVTSESDLITVGHLPEDMRVKTVAHREGDMRDALDSL
ncbi:MAG: sigma 54-interacting transcriptional regulator, partial [Rhodospirillaceae bacterium]|nr:sigma 54-interacting transcriptional regulator [Rhodospirillaceae bacterium]